MRLCNSPGGNLWLERGSDTDHVGVSKVTAASQAIQGATVAMQVPMEDKSVEKDIIEGFYFELQIKKVWPTAMLPAASDLATGPAVGFTQIPPKSGFSALNARAKDWPLSWVVGYDGTFHHNGVEKAPSLLSTAYNVHEFRRQRDTKLAAVGSTEARVDWPKGALGWSFVELLRDDVLGLLAKRSGESGELIIYVNGRVVSSLMVEGLQGAQKLFPLVELCGVVREAAFLCSPVGPGSEEERDEVLRSKDHVAAMVEALATRSSSNISDVYAAALIAQQVFQSHTLPEVPLSFVKLLSNVELWLQQGRPDISEHNGMLIALSQWASTINDCCMLGENLPPEIRDVLKRVLESSNLHPSNGCSNPIRSAGEFRAALNEQTACSHVPVEFLRSHIRNTRHRQREADDVWDLTPWRLSSSHIRRVMVVLQSQDRDGHDHVGSVNIGKLEANIPDQLLLHFAECFAHSTPERRTPRLLFRGFPLPADACPPLNKICEANAAVLLLRFVRQVQLNADSHSRSRGDPFFGPAGAKMIGSALRDNRMLEELNASSLQLEDRGMECIGEALSSCRLLRLELAQNRISAAGAQVLSQALVAGCVLQHLELQGNQIGCGGAAFLADMLKENASLEYLGLQRNGISASGATKLGTALISNSSLEELDLGRNTVGAAGCAALAAATRSNACLQRLNLQDNALEILAGTALAEELSAGLQSNIDGLLDRVPLKRSPQNAQCRSHLVALNLRHNDLGSLGVAAIATALQISKTHLSELNLAWNDQGLEAAAALANLMGSQSLSILTKLDLRDNRGLGTGQVLPKALSRLAAIEREKAHSGQHLRWLNLANIELDSEGAALLAPAMTLFCNLEELYLYNNIGLSCGPRLLEKEPKEGTERDFRRARTTQGISRLARSLPHSLTTLDLGSCALGPYLAAELLGILGSLHLHYLGLCDNDLGEEPWSNCFNKSLPSTFNERPST